MDLLELADSFDRERPRLRSVAYRIVGSLSDADDAVQEAWLRLQRADAEDIDNLERWLTTVVARICLNVLRGGYSHPEQPLDAFRARADHLDRRAGRPRARGAARRRRRDRAAGRPRRSEPGRTPRWRGAGPALKLAKAVRNVLGATSIPLPQTMPSNPKSPLDDKRLGKILGGQADIGDEGVVTVLVSRKGRIVIDGIRVSPEANISTNDMFRALDPAGKTAAVAPDVSMTAPEIGRVVPVMRSHDWHVGCLYNQETHEHPQLYFAHMVKTGDPYTLAREVRQGIDQTNA